MTQPFLTTNYLETSILRQIHSCKKNGFHDELSHQHTCQTNETFISPYCIDIHKRVFRGGFEIYTTIVKEKPLSQYSAQGW